MGLRDGAHGEGASGVRSDAGGAPAPGPGELRRAQRSGAAHPHGGAVVHTRPTLHGRLGDARLQRQGRVSANKLTHQCMSCYSWVGLERPG